MGLLNNLEKKAQEKEDAKTQELIEKYQLNGIGEEYKKAIYEVNKTIAGTKLIQAGSLLSRDPLGYAEAQSSFQYAIIQQNWIIIKQLNEISKKLDK